MWLFHFKIFYPTIGLNFLKYNFFYIHILFLFFPFYRNYINTTALKIVDLETEVANLYSALLQLQVDRPDLVSSDDESDSDIAEPREDRPQAASSSQ